MPGYILIVDDHEIVRRGIRSLLSSRPEWKICGEAGDGVEAIEKAKASRPDVVLMNISMPRMNGLDAARIIRKDLPQTNVIIMSQNDPAVARRQAQEVDAAAYVAKVDLSEHLLPAIASILQPGIDASAAAREPSQPTTLETAWLAGDSEIVVHIVSN